MVLCGFKVPAGYNMFLINLLKQKYARFFDKCGLYIASVFFSTFFCSINFYSFSHTSYTILVFLSATFPSSSQNQYDISFFRKVYNLPILQKNELVNLNSKKGDAFRIEYRTNKEFSSIAKTLAIMDDLKVFAVVFISLLCFFFIF